LSAGDGQYSGFSFNLDPKLASENDDADLPDFDADEANTPFKGTYLDAFPGLKVSSTSFMAPPGSPYPQTPIRSLFDQTGARPLSAISMENPDGSGYKGVFNPFAENSDTATSSQNPRPSLFIDDGERKMSRFGFAQGRKGSTAASSPMALSSPLSDGQPLFYTPAEFPPPPASAPSQWLAPTLRPQYSEFAFPAPTAPPTHAIPIPSTYPQSPGRFQPFESSVSESQLRDFIQTNRAQNELSGKQFPSV
jgi:CCR4-NOT transcription complex subunit 4